MTSNDKKPAPLVGISTCVKEINTLPFHAVNQRYLLALSEAAGVMPMMVPALGDRIDFAELAGRLNGLVVTGSPSNIEPHHYGCERARDDILHDPARDATTLPLLREAIRQGLPVFAVCRGIQELNVVMGGTLHQFLHEVPGRLDHRSDKSKPIGERAGLSHPVTLTPGGALERIAGRQEVMVNSLHGQGIDRVGDGLLVEAVSPDGVVEAVSVADAPTFQIGVQWHPEALYNTDEFACALFRAFGNAVREHAAGRTAKSRAAA